MELLKKDIKWIILIIVLMIVVSGVSVFATNQYLASQVYYTKQDGTTITVSEALNGLYNNQINSNNEFGGAAFETYLGDRKNISVTKKVNKGKYLVTVSRTLGGVNSTSFSADVDEDNSSELTCDKNCNINKLSGKNIYNTASSKNNNAYAFYDNFLLLYEITVEEDDTTITYNYTISSASTYALGCILETIELK